MLISCYYRGTLLAIAYSAATVQGASAGAFPYARGRIATIAPV